MFLCGGVNSNHSPYHQCPDKSHQTHGSTENTSRCFSVVGSTQTIPPYHQCADKSHQTHGRHVFCCGQNPSHILTHRGPIGEGGAKFAQLWPPFHIQFGHLDILSKCGEYREVGPRPALPNVLVTTDTAKYGAAKCGDIASLPNMVNYILLASGLRPHCTVLHCSSSQQS